MIAYSTMCTEFKISSVLVWTIYVSVTFFVACEALGGSTRSDVAIPKESTSSSITLMSIVVPALISSTVVSLSVLVVCIVLLIVLHYCIRLVDRLIVLSVLQV